MFVFVALLGRLVGIRLHCYSIRRVWPNKQTRTYSNARHTRTRYHANRLRRVER